MRTEQKISRAIVVAACLTILCGCGSGNEKKINLILSQDPDFKEVLLLKRDADEQIGLLKKQIKQDKKEAHTKIVFIKDQLREKEEKAKVAIKSYKDKLAEKRTRVTSRIVLLKKELKEYKDELKVIEKTVKERRIIMKKSTDIGGASINSTDWERKSVELSEKKRTLNERVVLLKSKIWMYNTELKFIH